MNSREGGSSPSESAYAVDSFCSRKKSGPNYQNHTEYNRYNIGVKNLRFLFNNRLTWCAIIQLSNYRPESKMHSLHVIHRMVEPLGILHSYINLRKSVSFSSPSFIHGLMFCAFSSLMHLENYPEKTFKQ